MENMDELSRLLKPKLDERLSTHLSSINLSVISRLPPERLAQTALPNIGLIELVSGNAFAELYDELYLANFHDGERERSSLIVSRLHNDFNGKRHGLAPYRVIGIRNSSGQAAGAAQFSVLFLKDGKHAVPFLQYIYVRPENRRQDLSEVMHTLVLAVAMADAAEVKKIETPQVPFTFMETEPPVHGVDESKRANAAERTQIHAKSGSEAMMLRRISDGMILSAHVQPGLEVGDPPLTYVWALRANPAVDLILGDQAMGKLVVAAYYQSLRDEGFPEENIAFAERLVEERYRAGVEFCLMPLSGITREMYVDIDVERELEKTEPCNVPISTAGVNLQKPNALPAMPNTQWHCVYKLKLGLTMQDPDMPSPRFHTVIFVETHASGPNTGTKHHVTGDITSGMYYESKPYDDPESDETLYSKEFIGYTNSSLYPQAFDTFLSTVPAPPKQKAFNIKAMKTEPVKSWDPLTFYEPGEARPPLMKCTEWIEYEAIPTLIARGFIVQKR